MSTPSLINARSLPRLGNAVASLRKKRNLSQAELAHNARVSRQWLSGLENGKIRGLEVGKLMQLLDALDANLMISDRSDGGSP